MGLANKLSNQNSQTAQILASAQTPVSVGGYNQQNVPALTSAPPMGQDEFNKLLMASKEAQSSHSSAI
jgi:hypothetical protein